MVTGDRGRFTTRHWCVTDRPLTRQWRITPYHGRASDTSSSRQQQSALLRRISRRVPDNSRQFVLDAVETTAVEANESGNGKNCVMKKSEPGEIQKTALSGSRLSGRNSRKRIAKDLGAVTNARLLGSTGFRSAPSPSRPRPVPPRNRALVTSGLYCADAHRSVGTLAPALRYFLRTRPSLLRKRSASFANIPTEAITPDQYHRHRTEQFRRANRSQFNRLNSMPTVAVAAR